MFLEIAFLLIFLLCMFYFINHNPLRSKWSFPPGPQGLPFFGSLFSLVSSSNPPHLKFCEWATKYGGIYTVNILTKNILIVSCPKLMRQVFEHSASIGKYELEPIKLLANGYFGITATEGHVWSEQRKFCVRTLRKFGMGKRSEIQTTILSEADQAIQWIKKEAKENDGVISSPIKLFKTVTSNTLWKIVRGERYALDDDSVRNMTTDFSDAVNLSFKRGIGMCPWLKWVAPEWSGYNDLVKCITRLRSYIQNQVEEHQQKREMNDSMIKEEPKDMIDAYLDQMEKVRKSEDKSSTFYGENGWNHSIAVLGEMFAGGGESTPHSLNWLLLLLCHYQDAQRMLQEEIDRVLGTQEPCLMDKSRMPYTEAVILESLRRCPTAPLTFAHKLTEDVNNLCGFKLPRGTLLLSNLYQALMNKEFWGDPETFRPERFMVEGNTTQEMVTERKASVVAFNVGKRACLGEPLAMDVLFLFVVKLFQAFEISPFPENSKPDFNSTEAFLLKANPFNVTIKERN